MNTTFDIEKNQFRFDVRDEDNHKQSACIGTIEFDAPGMAYKATIQPLKSGGVKIIGWADMPVEAAWRAIGRWNGFYKDASHSEFLINGQLAED